MLWIHHQDPKFVILVNLKCMSQSFEKLINEGYPEANPRFAWMYPEIKEENDLSEYYQFGVVRNPLSRVVSCYESKTKRDWRGNFHEIHELIFNFFDVEGSEIKKQKFLNDLSFTKFCKFVRENFFKDPHTLPQFMLYVDKKANFVIDNIFKLEEVDSWKPEVENKLNCKIPKRNSSNWKYKSYEKYYNYRTETIVSNIYRRDLDLFNYNF